MKLIVEVATPSIVQRPELAGGPLQAASEAKPRQRQF